MEANDIKKQQKETIDKFEKALKSESYYILIATAQEIYEAQHNKPFPDIIYTLDFIHSKKMDELKELFKKQNNFKMK